MTSVNFSECTAYYNALTHQRANMRLQGGQSPAAARREVQNIYAQHGFGMTDIYLRRKIQILKYPASTSFPIVRGANWRYQSQQTQSSLNRIYSLDNACSTMAATDFPPTWSYQCDVPGKPFTMALNPAVPLFM